MPPATSSPGNGVGGTEEQRRNDDPAWQLRKYLLLLAILVATVTYVAGLDPPGGVWLETKDGHRTGNPILPATRRVRYTLFYYFNATAFAASLVVILLLLFMTKHVMLRAVRGVMVLDMLCLMVAYVAGSCRGRLTTICASVLCAAVLAVVVLAICVARNRGEDEEADKDQESHGKLRAKEWRKVTMLLAIFVTTITYTAALNPPGGFWEHAVVEARQDGHGHASSHRAGDPILLERHPARFVVFLLCNTAAFAASLVVITLLLSSRLSKKGAHRNLNALYGCIAAALLSLVGAYAAGSCRGTDTTVYVLGLVGAVVLCICILAFVESRHPSSGRRQTTTTVHRQHGGGGNKDPLEKARSLILLLATLAATVTYQAGLDPPGGVWRENGDGELEGHNGGDLILLGTHAIRYKVFFYCNSAAFVASVVVVIMVQSRHLVSRHALEAAVILDLLGLMGAYAAGSCRDVRTSAYVFALAAVIFIGVVTIYFVIERAPSPAGRKEEDKDNNQGQNGENVGRGREKEKKRKLLLLLAILAVTITYQAGLTPPGKFWLEHGDAVHHVGDPVLADNYPRRYKAFFYCNATSFMASVAVIVILVGRDLSDANNKYLWPLYACMAAGMVGLMGAYAVGTTRRVRTSIYVFALVVAVLVFAVLHILVLHDKIETWMSQLWSSPSHTPAAAEDEDHHGNGYTQRYKMCKYLMLLGILAASVTYQAGLDPPGGVWPTDGEGHAAGDPTLHDSDRRRYHAFFYSNSASFVASIVVIVLLLLLQGLLPRGNSPMPIRAMHTVAVLDLLSLLVAYATGGSRDWGTSGYVLAMAATVLAYVAIHVLLSSRGKEPGQDRMVSSSGQNGCGSGSSEAADGQTNGQNCALQISPV